MRILTLPFPFLLHLITHKALWMSLLLLCLSLTCFLLFITIPTPHCRRFICYWDYCKWCLVSNIFSSNLFSILLQVIFLTENIISPFFCLKFSNRFPLPKQNLQTSWHHMLDSITSLLTAVPWRFSTQLQSYSTHLDLNVMTWNTFLLRYVWVLPGVFKDN